MDSSMIGLNKGRGWERVAPWFYGLGVSLLLFVGVVISGRPSEEPPAIEVSHRLEEIVLPPPPVREDKPLVKVESQSTPVNIDFHNFPSKEAIKLLDVKIAPKKDQNLLGRITFDLNSLDVTMKEVNDNFIYNPNEVDDPPAPIFQPFPSISRKLMRQKGQRVGVMFYVDENGRVESPYVIESSDVSLNEIVLKTLLKWRYQPARKNRVPVCCWVRTSIILSADAANPFRE